MAKIPLELTKELGLPPVGEDMHLRGLKEDKIVAPCYAPRNALWRPDRQEAREDEGDQVEVMVKVCLRYESGLSWDGGVKMSRVAEPKGSSEDKSPYDLVMFWIWEWGRRKCGGGPRFPA